MSAPPVDVTLSADATPPTDAASPPGATPPMDAAPSSSTAPSASATSPADAILSVDTPPVDAPAKPRRTGAAPWRAWLDALRAALPVWLTAYTGYLLVTTLGWGVAARPDTPSPDLDDTLNASWHRWDAKLFDHLVEHGYQPERAELTAIFPLYPGLVRQLDGVLP